MRVRLPLGRSLFFACALLFMLVALLPLRLALDWLGLGDRGFAAREARGSLWLGAVSEAQWGPVALGDLQARLRTLPLFVGRARVDLERGDEGDPFDGSVTIGRHAFGIDDLTARLDVGAAFAPLPIASLDLTDISAHFANGQCASAEGTTKANLAGEVAGMALPAGLSGTVRCDGGALLLPLASQSGLERLDLRLFDDGRYEIGFTVRPTDEAMRARLVASGFGQTAQGYRLSVSGDF